jgi:hypothetical protein
MAKKELITDEQWLALKAQFERKAAGFIGDIPTFESAWGALLLGTQYGWKVAFLVHSQSTIKKYEDITGFKFREVCPPETQLSKKSIAFKALQKVSSFWKAVRGETKDVRSPVAT